MTDVDEIIYFIKTLKKGFDKDLFQSKIDELAYVVDTDGLSYEDFHILFKVWLNLSIPITKWVSLGSCLVPSVMVEDRTVEYALRWILANLDNQPNYSRVGFLLDWLTAAMECDFIKMVSLDMGYEVFYTILTSEVLTVHALKLVYTLTKPADVTRRRVRELLEYAKIREGKKNMFRQLQVLLGLFKSYKPECVPEDIPTISIHAAFKKLNVPLLARFQKNQELRNRLSKERHHLLWTNPLNSDRSRNKKADPLVPNMQFNEDSNRFGKEPIKTHIDFSDPVSLVQYSLHHTVSRPARLRALLCNATGLALLAASSHPMQTFLSHDLHHLLHSCFLEVSPHSYAEKRDLLQRLAVLQRTVVQGIPVITRFLAQYLPLWNERDYFNEMLELVEWVSILCPEHIHCIVESLSRLYRRAQPVEQCAVLRSLTTMYTNLVYASTKTRYHFLNIVPSQTNYQKMLPDIAAKISDLCNKELQVNPDELHVLYSTVLSAERRATAELSCGASSGPLALPQPLTLALPLLTASAGLIDSTASLMILYKKIISASKDENEKQILTLSNFMSDMLNCLYRDEALSGRKEGLVFHKLHPQLVSTLGDLIPDVDAKLSLRNHLAFAPYTYLQVTCKDADNKICFKVLAQEFASLGKFLKKALPELRCQSLSTTS